MSYESNIYYHPEQHGLEQYAIVEREPDYNFNMVVVWKETATGKYYFGADSGCSCPSPFEDFRGKSDLTELTKETWYNLEEAVGNIYGLPPEEATKFFYLLREIV